VRLALASQRGAPVTGVEGLIGEPGIALEPLVPGLPGRVRAHGEIWTALAHEPVGDGESITVTNINGLTLTVRKQ
jgi:membrane-bound serine protease (ClpP class)